MPFHEDQMNLTERLATFHGFWDHDEAAARQLAATGHVYDRPPLEALEEGSRCISCSAFVKREDSIRILQGPVKSLSDESSDADCHLHHPQCIRLQLRIPLDLLGAIPSTFGAFSRIAHMCKRWERFAFPTDSPNPQPGQRRDQTSPLFYLPTELRLEIYSQILPHLDKGTSIVSLNRDSGRIVTKAGFEKPGRRDDTKINILSTCRLVYEEALDILYTGITYRFESTKLLYLFLRHIGSHGRQLLKAVDVVCGSREDAAAFALLGACPKLRSITIRLPRPMLLFPRAPLWCIDGVAALLELSGLEEVLFGECARSAVSARCLKEESHDGKVLKRELMRPRGERSAVRWVNGTLDL